MGGFPGANTLTNQLSPVSLQQRKQQLINQMVTGRKAHTIVGGSGMPIAPGLGSNPLLAGLFQAGYGQDAGGQFYGGGGSVQTGNGAAQDAGQTGASPSPTNFVSNPMAPSPNPTAPWGIKTSGGLNPFSGGDTNVIQTLLAQMFSGGSGAGRAFAS